MKPTLIKDVTDRFGPVVVQKSDRLLLGPPVVSFSNGACLPTCPICGGSGYIRKKATADVYDPDFGKVERCPQARRLAFSEALSRGQVDGRIGLTADEIQSLTWDAIKDGLSDGHKAREAVALALQEGKRAAYANMLTVLDDIRLAFDEKENKQTELVRRVDWWLSRDVLAIDELDKTNSTDWARERIFQLLDARYQRAVRQEALTLIAGNYSHTDELCAYLRSRIEDNRFAANGMIVPLNGPDGRKAVPDGWKY